MDEQEAVGLVAARLAEKFAGYFNEAQAAEAAEQRGRPGAEPRPPVVSRTMAEAGEICDDCTHPFGRHEFEAGCAAYIDVDGRRVRCHCLGDPDRAGVTYQAGVPGVA